MILTISIAEERKPCSCPLSYLTIIVLDVMSFDPELILCHYERTGMARVV